MIQFGDIAYLNTLPVMAAFWRSYADAFSLTRVRGTPSQLNTGLLSGSLDISGISAACFVRHQQDLLLLPELSISSNGPVESVLILSPVPWQQLASQPFIHVSGASASAATMLQYLLPNLRQVIFLPEALNSLLECSEPILVIGDQALTLTMPCKSHPYVIDVATQWHQQTHLPAVFGVWAARRTWAETHPERFQAISHALIKSKADFFGSDSFQQIVISEALADSGQTLQGLSMQRIQHYLTQSIRYDWSPAHEAAVTRLATVSQNQDAASLVRPLS
ncbi:MAG: menaquinone biosynthesis protein [Vampirovibrionales bacterium]|nr:menaquinone biosynthesis protein [Vampirovibrionales bacterium]